MFRNRRATVDHLTGLRKLAASEAPGAHVNAHAIWVTQRNLSAQLHAPADVVEAVEEVRTAYENLDKALDRLCGICRRHL